MSATATTTAIAPTQKNILVILAHPRKESLCGGLARRYADAAREAGGRVRSLDLADLPFDPVLHEGYLRPQEWEATLDAAWMDVTWAQHLVFVYPNWWGTFPALLKGFFDRVFLPGKAFKYRPDSPMWDKLLTGRSARVLVTMDSPPWYYRFLIGAPGDKQIKRSVLGFCGIAPVHISHFGSVRNSTAEQRGRWLDKVASLARDDV